jgi:protein-tyrosine phosphatase
VPDSTEDAVSTLRTAHARAEFERVEIACAGGVGRTGSAIAVLAAMCGVHPDDAVAWTRANYYHRAVETRRQRRWVVDVARSLLA